MSKSDLTELAKLGLIAVIAWKALDWFKTGRETLGEIGQAVYEHGEAVGEFFTPLVTTPIYQKFKQDTLTKWTSLGYKYLGEYTWDDKNAITKDYGDTVAQAVHAGSIPFEQDIWMVFYKPSSFGVTGSW